MQLDERLNKFKKFCLGFQSSSILYLVAPSLLSKMWECKDEDYFNKQSNLELSDIFPNPLKIISLIFSFLRIILFYLKNNSNKNNIVCLLTRSAGLIKNLSYEDRRFKGLEKEISKKGFKIIYYFHGKVFKRKIFHKHPIIYSDDVFSFAKLFLIVCFPALILNPFLTKKDFPQWKLDIYLNLYASLIISIFARFFKKAFFWDFNYYHYPLFLGSYYANAKLIGSMHNYHVDYIVPWISSDIINHLKIEHSFTDYNSTYKLFKKNKHFESLRNSKQKIFFKDISICIIQEKQTDQKELLKFICKNISIIKKLYVKLGTNKARNIDFLNQLQDFNLKYKIIKEIFDDFTSEFLFIGNSSTLLLELASKGRLALTFNTSKKNPFNCPAREFMKIRKEYNETCKYLENPSYLSENFSMNNLEIFQNDIVASESLLNHYIFESCKIKSLVNQITK